MDLCVHQEMDPVTGTLVSLCDVLVMLTAPWKHFLPHQHPKWSVMQRKWGCQLEGEKAQEVGNVLHELLGSSCEGRMCYHGHLSLKHTVGHWTADDCLHRLTPAWSRHSVLGSFEAGRTRVGVLQDQPASKVREMLQLFL